MRPLLASLFIFSFAASAHAAGAYASRETANADACARLCEDDGLCVAWTFTENACSMRATAPNATPNGVSGFSRRAPAQLRQQIPNASAPAIAAPAPVAAPSQEEASTIAPPPPQQTVLDLTEPDSADLLGGPEPSPTALRPRLGRGN